MALTRELLALATHDTVYFEPANCHPESPVRAYYEKSTGECTIMCAECDNIVVVLVIAES